jgi:hypothetical protein
MPHNPYVRGGYFGIIFGIFALTLGTIRLLVNVFGSSQDNWAGAWVLIVLEAWCFAMGLDRVLVHTDKW